MPCCDGKPNERCLVADSTVKLSQGELMLCPSCEEFRFPNLEKAGTSKEKDKTRNNDRVRAKDREVSKINRPPRNEVADTSKVVKEELNKCGDCGKTVLKKDNGVLCEVCDSWLHNLSKGI